MKYLALYRKYRPSRFDEITGQESVVKILKNAIINNRISHAYLFCGPRGTGKTTIAKLFAKMVNCSNPIDGEPCGKCENCTTISNGVNDDVIEIDAASNNGVDEIRELRDKINLVPASSKYKVYIIDEVHMLTVGAFNALLKTLEEPPQHVIFILATTENFKVPLTISSRCQKFRFEKISVENIVLRLKKICENEKLEIGEDVLGEIARLSDGGMRDAISLLDQLVSYKGTNFNVEDVYDISGIVSYDVIADLLMNVHNNDVLSVVKILEKINNNGKNIVKFLEEMMFFLKELLILKKTGDNANITIKNEKMNAIGKLYSSTCIYKIVEKVNTLLNEIKNTNYPMLLLEITLINLMEKKNETETFVGDVVTVKNVNKIEIKSEKSVKKEENVSKKKEKSVIIGNDYDSKYYDYLKMVRVNNAFVDANKSLLNKFKEKWSLIFDYLSDDKYSSVVGLLKDVFVVVVGSENVIFVSKYVSILEKINSLNSVVSELLFKVYGFNYKVIVLSEDEWNNEKNKYVNNLNNKYIYKKMEEQQKNAENTKKNENKKNDSIMELVDIVGEEVIEYK